MCHRSPSGAHLPFIDTYELSVGISILETTTSIRRLATAEFAKRDLNLFEPTFADFRVKVSKSQTQLTFM